MKNKLKFRERIDRRDFMGKATVAIGGVIGAALAIPAVAYGRQAGLSIRENSLFTS
jgi:hypothetical protein